MVRRGVGTIETVNALINDNYALIRNVAKYMLNDKGLTNAEFLRASYRRFIRLRPFVSNRSMVKDTYTDYIRYKYRYEDYPKRMAMIGVQCDNQLNRSQVKNSLSFVAKACSFIDESKGTKFEVARDNTMCRQILKNLLTVHYEKTSHTNEKRTPLRHIFQYSFEHMKDINKSTNSQSYSKPASPKSSLILDLYGEFDRDILLLNNLLNMRL